MILGMSVPDFTLLHVIISLIGIVAGLVALGEILVGKPLATFSLWNTLFLVTTIATSVTGFFFHSKSIGPPHIVGAISLAVLAVGLFALYGRHLAGIWRATYAASAVVALYLNSFVGVVQAFQKLKPLQALAPTQSEPPFLVAQAMVLGLFAVLGFLAVRRLQPSRRLFP